MGYIKKRSRNWQATYRGPDGRERTKTFPTKIAAKKWLDTNSADIARGLWIDPHAGEIPFSKYSERWLVARPDLRPRTVTLYKSLLNRHLVPTFGATPIAKVTPSAVGRWHSALVAHKPAAAASAYRLLRAIFATAVRDELLLRSPCRVRKGAADRAIERPMLTVAEVGQLVEGMPDNLRTAVTLAAWGGLRRGEVLALRRKDVDLLHSRLHVREAQTELNDGTVLFGPPKTDAGARTVHLPDAATEALKAHLAKYVDPAPESLLFTGRGGVPMRSRTLEDPFRTVRASCGLSHVRFHDLRHFALTMAAATGATTKELMRRAGHASPAAAIRYQHATEDRDRAIATALSGLAQSADILKIPRTSRGHSGPRRSSKGR